MFRKGRTLPPRSLIALIVAITVVPLATLLWLGWRLLEQDRILESQRAQDRMERAADLVVAAVQRALFASEQRLAAGDQDWPAGAVAVTFRGDRVETSSNDRLAYLPVVPQLREASASVFAEGEDLEFRRQDHHAAIEFFRGLTKSSDAAIRAGALLRVGRNLAGAGRIDEALTAYDQLAALDDVSIAGTPAGLIGRYARCELLEKAQRPSEFKAEVERFATELNSSRWLLTGPLYWLYAGDVAKWNGAERTHKRESELFAEVATSLWERRQSLPVSGREAISIVDQTFVVLWQSSSDSIRVLIATPEFARSQWQATAGTLATEQRVSFSIDDAALNKTQPAVKRSAKQTELPWNVVIGSTGNAQQGAEFANRRRLLIAGFVLLAVMALMASYLIIRAVRHELAVARLQSDFVAAVSHEFRTPLTALRQFTDMLRENERFAPQEGKERRLLSFEAQSRATERLTKLVESLLDFGRMEAGARRYTFESQDCTEFVSQVVEDFRRTAEAAGYSVKFCGNGSVSIEADSEALGRAIWNLMDNAVKYSPSHHTIEVEVHRLDGSVGIGVRDHGIGIPSHECDVIFRKFQRGEEARIRGIKGTGIGLTMVDEIVKAHRGHVEVKSEPGLGSTFTIVLPIKGQA